MSRTRMVEQLHASEQAHALQVEGEARHQRACQRIISLEVWVGELLIMMERLDEQLVQEKARTMGVDPVTHQAVIDEVARLQAILGRQLMELAHVKRGLVFAARCKLTLIEGAVLMSSSAIIGWFIGAW